MQIFNGWRDAAARGESPMSALWRYMGRKLRNEGKNRALASDLVWSFCGERAA